MRVSVHQLGVGSVIFRKLMQSIIPTKNDDIRATPRLLWMLLEIRMVLTLY